MSGTVAQERGIEVIDGVAEALPFQGEQFDFVLMVTNRETTTTVNSIYEEVTCYARKKN